MGFSNKRAVFITIIVFLVFFGTGTVLGIVGKVMEGKNEDPLASLRDSNPNKEFYYNGKLYFYDHGELLGVYQCSEGHSYCGFAYEYLDDSGHSLDYYDDRNIDSFGMIGNKYALISDSVTGGEYAREDGVLLYDIVGGKVLLTYQAVKDYSIGIEGSMYIVRNDNKWGILKIDENSAMSLVSPQYDFIGLQNVTSSSGKLVSDEFAVKLDEKWFIMDATGRKLSSDFAEDIVSYNGASVIVKNVNGFHQLYNYNGNSLLGGYSFNKLVFVGRYVGVFNASNQFYLAETANGQTVSQMHNYSSVNDITFEYQENSVIIKKGGMVLETVTM